MKKIERITKYVSNLFDQYSMNDYGFFRDYDEDADETIEVPLFRYGKVDKDTIEKISINFGITPEEILNTDDSAAMRYWNKYPFFKLYKQYLHLSEWNQKYKDPEPTAEELLFNAIFAVKKGISVRYRYDIPSIKERLVQQLKEYDAVMPGVYHEGAEITDLRISTQTMLSFPECPAMIQSFLDMTDRLQELFYKAIETELLSDEINEMNNTLYSTEINQYILYEKAEHSLYERHCIDGKIVGRSKCCGYCQCKEHPGFLTEKLRKQHNCIAKQCFHYIGKPKKEKSTLQETQDRSSLILSIAKQISAQNEGVRVLRVESGTVLNHYTAFFVTITNDYSFEEYIEEIYRSIGVYVAFKKLDYDFDKCVALIQAS